MTQEVKLIISGALLVSLLSAQQTINGITGQAVTGTTPVAGGSNGQIQYNNSTAIGGFTLGGDCTFAQPNITCTKVNGQTVSLSGNLTTTGSFNPTFAIPSSSTWTFPAAGTLVNTGVATLSSLTSIGTIGTGVWQGTIVTGTYGGTGINNGSNTLTLSGNMATTGSFNPTFAIPSSSTWTFPSAGGTLDIKGASTATGTKTSAVNTVVSGSTPAFDLSLGNIQYLTALAVNAAPTVSNITAGGNWTFIICQDGTGSRTWTWPASFKGAATIGTTLSKCSSQSFASADGTTIYATDTGNINQ